MKKIISFLFCIILFSQLSFGSFNQSSDFRVRLFKVDGKMLNTNIISYDINDTEKELLLESSKNLISTGVSPYSLIDRKKDLYAVGISNNRINRNEPNGILMNSGNLIYSSNISPSIILKDQSFAFDNIKIKMDFESTNSSTYINISQINTLPINDNSICFFDDNRKQIANLPEGFCIIVQNNKILNIKYVRSYISVPDNGYIIFIPKTLISLSQIKKIFKINDSVKSKVTISNNTKELYSYYYSTNENIPNINIEIPSSNKKSLFIDVNNLNSILTSKDEFALFTPSYTDELIKNLNGYLINIKNNKVNSVRKVNSSTKVKPPKQGISLYISKDSLVYSKVSAYFRKNKNLIFSVTDSQKLLEETELKEYINNCSTSFDKVPYTIISGTYMLIKDNNLEALPNDASTCIRTIIGIDKENKLYLVGIKNSTLMQAQNIAKQMKLVNALEITNDNQNFMYVNNRSLIPNSKIYNLLKISMK